MMNSQKQVIKNSLCPPEGHLHLHHSEVYEPPQLTTLLKSDRNAQRLVYKIQSKMEMLRFRVVGQCHGLLPSKAFSQGWCSCLGFQLHPLCPKHLNTTVLVLNELCWCMSEKKPNKPEVLQAGTFFWCLEGNVHVSGTA